MPCIYSVGGRRFNFAEREYENNNNYKRITILTNSKSMRSCECRTNERCNVTDCQQYYQQQVGCLFGWRCYISYTPTYLPSGWISYNRETLGLPTVPHFPGRPVFWPHCPASRPRYSRDAKCPVFRPCTNGIEIAQQMYA